MSNFFTDLQAIEKAESFMNPEADTSIQKISNLANVNKIKRKWQ
jgi:hypothetical protein